MSEIHRLGVGVGGKLMISVYLREHKSGDCYYGRYKISNPKSGSYQRYITESLQTTNLEHAKERARTRYAEISMMELQGKSIKSDTVSVEITRFIEEYESGVENKIGSYTSSMLLNYKKTIVRYWKEYIGHLDVKNITWDHLNDYEVWRQNYYKKKKEEGKKYHQNSKLNVSTKTVELEVNSFKAFLRWCSIKGKYFGNALDYKYRKTLPNKRSAFTTSQWSKLTGYMRRNSWLVVGRRGNDTRLIRHRHMLKTYVLFMKNTGLRVGESRKLRWMDVEFVNNEDPSKCFLRIKVLKENSKTRKGSIVIGNEGSHNTLKEWFTFRTETEDFVNPEDFIWCDVDGRNINDFREGFNTLISNDGVYLDASGNKLTCYSLRHTYITEQLKNNVPIYTIASNCNTSVSMIETYYSDARNKDFEDVLTKGYRKESNTSTKTTNKPTRKTVTKTITKKKVVKKKV